VNHAVGTDNVCLDHVRLVDADSMLVMNGDRISVQRLHLGAILEF